MIANTRIPPRHRRPLAAALLSTALLVVGPAHAEDDRATSEAEATAQSDRTMRGIDKSDIRRGEVRDADGDGHADASAVAGGKALADVVKHSEAPDSAARLGDPIPGIDLACAPRCALTPAQPGMATSGSRRESAATTDATTDAVPALDANPLP